MAEAVVSSAVKWIGSLLIQKVKSLHGVEGQVKDMLKELGDMQCFLRDADARQHESHAIRHLIVEIRNFAYHAENVIARFVVEVEFRRRGGVRNTFMRYACIFNEVIALNSIGSEIDSMKSEITRLTANLRNFGVNAVVNRGGGSSSALRGQPQLRRTYSHNVEKDLVGFENDVEILVGELLDKGVKHHRVVSIWAMGGLGKTTLAGEVYYHKDVREKFKRFAWVAISQQWQPKDVIREILTKLVPNESGQIAGMIEALQVKQLYEVQQQEKYLIVLDDIWSNDAWINLSPAFPDANMSSRIILTTRFESVATFVSPNGFLHKPRCLSPEESWKLFKKKAYATDLEVDPMMQKEGKEMVAECGGLPLAIVVLGGLLATKPTLREWQAVHQNLASYLDRGTNIGGGQDGRVFQVLALSYQDLPYHLKACFLCLGHYPEDSSIDVETLYDLWLAEDIISQEGREGEESVVDVGDRYMSELAQRCIVQVLEIESPSPYVGFGLVRRKICQLHDLMRDLCLLKAEEEDFLKVISYGQTDEQLSAHPSSSSSSMAKPIVGTNCSEIHRLAFHQNSNGNLHLLKHEENIRHLRFVSFFLIKRGLDYLGEEELTHFFKGSKFLRAIHFHGSGSDIRIEGKTRLLKEIGNLILLRHLSIRGVEFTKVPSSLGNLRYLETLDLRASSQYEVSVPNVLWKLKRLIHLYLPKNMITAGGIPLRLDGLSKLETLENVDSEQVDFKSLSKLTNLRRLWLVEIRRNLEDLARVNDCLVNCKLLQETSITISSVDGSSEEGLRPLRQVLSCDALVQLELSSIEGEGYPMAALEKLPNLRFLKYNRCFAGREIVCSAGGFLRLEHLQLWSLEIEEWRVELGAMPNLSFLKIGCCENLQMLPDGLRFISTLKILVIMRMPEAFNNRLRVVDGEEGEDYHKIRHIPYIQIYSY